jgi:hypothetical protein
MTETLLLREPEYLTAEDASRYVEERGVRISAEMLKWYARHGRLAYSRPGKRLLFTRADLNALLDWNRVEARET